MAHSVNGDICDAMIYPPAHSKTYINLYFLKWSQIMGCYAKRRFKSTLPTSNDILSEYWIGLLCSLTAY